MRHDQEAPIHLVRRNLEAPFERGTTKQRSTTCADINTACRVKHETVHRAFKVNDSRVQLRLVFGHGANTPDMSAFLSCSPGRRQPRNTCNGR